MFPFQVLKKTGEYITHMQKKIVDHQDEIKSLKSENSQLENQIKALERAKATGNFVNTRSILDSDDIVAADNIGKTFSVNLVNGYFLCLKQIWEQDFSEWKEVLNIRAIMGFFSFFGILFAIMQCAHYGQL